MRSISSEQIGNDEDGDIYYKKGQLQQTANERWLQQSNGDGDTYD